jgi:hypothetical protein
MRMDIGTVYDARCMISLTTFSYLVASARPNWESKRRQTTGRITPDQCGFSADPDARGLLDIGGSALLFGRQGNTIYIADTLNYMVLKTMMEIQ